MFEGNTIIACPSFRAFLRHFRDGSPKIDHSPCRDAVWPVELAQLKPTQDEIPNGTRRVHGAVITCLTPLCMNTYAIWQETLLRYANSPPENMTELPTKDTLNPLNYDCIDEKQAVVIDPHESRPV